MKEPRPTEVYRHWKTRDLYVVVGVSQDSEAWGDATKRCVVYFNITPDCPRDPLNPGKPVLIHRPLHMWFEHVERDGYSGPRFILFQEQRAS